MKGYKAVNLDMTSAYGSMQYEIGKEYILEEPLQVCCSGFHFCELLEDIEEYYSVKRSRIFKIDATGKIQNTRGIFCTDKIILTRELTGKEIQEYFQVNQEHVLQKGYYCKKAMAEQGVGLDKLINDKEWIIRKIVAEHNFKLEQLINDPEYIIRKEASKRICFLQ